jgi:hypothetical protein
LHADVAMGAAATHRECLLQVPVHRGDKRGLLLLLELQLLQQQAVVAAGLRHGGAAGARFPPDRRRRPELRGGVGRRAAADTPRVRCCLLYQLLYVMPGQGLMRGWLCGACMQV